MSDVHEITPALLRTMPLPHLESGDKEARGRAMVIAGCTELPGAVLLTGTAVLRAGAGKLQAATCGSVAVHLGVAMPEARVINLSEETSGAISPNAASVILSRASACGVVVIGPGMIDEDASVALTAKLLRGLDGPKVVLDAAAMSGLRKHRELLNHQAGRVVITPHPGEMAAMMGISKEEVETDPLQAARRAAAELNVVVALKGAVTWIAEPGSGAWVFRNGFVGLATAGSGDVLAGLIGGLLARGAEPIQAAAWAVHLHAEAGHRLTKSRGPVGFLARELLDEIPAAMADLC